LDYLHPCWLGDKYGADVAIGAIPAGRASGIAAVDCAELMGIMHFFHLVVILLDLNAGAAQYGKQANG
jgi:hypothetical protein